MAKRRAAGDGSLHRRARDGKWVATVDLGWKIGEDRVRRRVRRTVTSDTQAGARSKLRKLLRAKEDGVVTQAMTVETWLRHWLTKIIPTTAKPSTVSGYRGAIDRYLVPILGGKKLERLDVDDVRDMHETLAGWKVKRTGLPLSHGTIRHAHATLRSALESAVVEGHVSRNVAEIAKAPRAGLGAVGQKHPVLTVEQANAVISAAKGDARLRARLTLALVMGVRQGEALGLRWTDVRLDEGGRGGDITIQSTVQQIRGSGLQVGTPKSEASKRTVPLPDLVAGALLAWRQESGGRGYVFHGHKGPLSPNGPRRDYQVWADALELAGVPHVPLHGARGSAASMMHARGVPPVWIAIILGHAQVTTTEAHYIRGDRDQLLGSLQLAAGAIDQGER